MTLSPLADGSVMMHHRLLSATPLRRTWHFRVAAAPVYRCSQCNRLRIDDVWRFPDEIEPPPGDSWRPVHYGVCEECRGGLAPVQPRRKR